MLKRLPSSLLLVLLALGALLAPSGGRAEQPERDGGAHATIVTNPGVYGDVWLHEPGGSSVIAACVEVYDRVAVSHVRSAACRSADGLLRVSIRASQSALLTYFSSLSAHPARLLQTGVAPPGA